MDRCATQQPRAYIVFSLRKHSSNTWEDYAGCKENINASVVDRIVQYSRERGVKMKESVEARW